LISLAGPTPIRHLSKCSESIGCEVYGKLEIYNPTGSHKDRESEEIIRYAVHEGVRGLAIASTGNAAVSLAAYSYLSGIKCHVYLPEDIAQDRLAQIEAYHPIIRLIPGEYQKAIEECSRDAKRRGLLNCNPGMRPEKLSGDSHIGAEIAACLSPDYVVCPTNNGTLLAGVWLGFKKADKNTRMIAAVATETRLATAIAGFHRIEEPALSRCIKESEGKVVEVSDGEIAKAARLLMYDGMIVEGAAAAAVASLHSLDLPRRSRICCVITGSGLKFPKALRELLSGATP